VINFKDHAEDLIFLPIGGCNEIGINVNLYHYKGKWLMIDCGAGFPDDYLPGVEVVVADLSFIRKNKHNLVGLVLTHIHQDHVGALQFLWSDIECPIYTTKFTATFLKTKLSEYHLEQKIKINVINPGQRFTLAPFDIEMVPLTHSAPEMQALMIRTDAGNILHTGDWKFDHDPILGLPGDEERLKSYGDEGVLALVCDSTNVFNEEKSGSEGDLRKSIVDIVAGCPKMVVVTTFASNVARLDTLIHAGQKAGRKVVLTGRSLHNLLHTAQECGYLLDIAPLVDEAEVCRYKKEELLIIATGCQGEPLAAVSKMVNHNHNYIQLSSKDTVIFSSKIIPGNEKKIFRLFNQLVKSGIEVITERDHFVHVSGHPSISELRHMYDLVRPEIVVPVHGEAVHLHEHCKIAKKHGIRHAIEVHNGSVVKLCKSAPKVLDEVKTGYQVIDGNALMPSDSKIFKIRRQMRDDGIAIVTLFFSDDKLLGKPVVNLPGIVDKEEDFETANILVRILIKEFKARPQAFSNNSNDNIEQKVRNIVRRYLREETGKYSKILVNIERV
jgi:ribonuclease J